jgi:membrane protein implicated in regulation of membrane protease activity
MCSKHAATTAAIILVLAVCAFLVGLALDNAWVSIVAICVATLAAIYATAFYLQER